FVFQIRLWSCARPGNDENQLCRFPMRARRSEKVEIRLQGVAVEVEIYLYPNVLRCRLGIRERHVVCGFGMETSMDRPAILFGSVFVGVRPYPRQKTVHPICRPHRYLLFERSGYRPLRIRVAGTVRRLVET